MLAQLLVLKAFLHTALEVNIGVSYHKYYYSALNFYHQALRMGLIRELVLETWQLASIEWYQTG